MRRRDFIKGIAGLAAWPLAARGQQAESVRRIGVLMNLAADDPEGQARLTGFLQGLQESGWADGRNAHIDTRWGTDAGSTRKETGFARPRRHPGFCEHSHERIATDDPRCADRIRDCDRSGRCRIRRKVRRFGRTL